MEYPPLNLESNLPFGKYKGDLLEDVIMEDPGYVEWLIENTDVTLDPKAMELLDASLDNIEPNTPYLEDPYWGQT
jgi:hypothetical protein